MKNLLNKYKITLTNLFLVMMLLASYILNNSQYPELKMYLRCMSYIGLSASIINWIALEILLEKLSLIYHIDKIRKFIEPLKIFLIKDIFGAKNFDDLKNKYEIILNDGDKEKIEKNLYQLGLHNILQIFNNKKAKSLIKQNILEKIFEIETAIKLKIVSGLNETEKQKTGMQFFKEEILPIIENKLELSVLQQTQKSILETIKEYFKWLILWGAYAGIVFGIIFKLLFLTI